MSNAYKSAYIATDIELRKGERSPDDIARRVSLWSRQSTTARAPSIRELCTMSAAGTRDALNDYVARVTTH